MTVAEAARVSKVSYARLDRWIRSGLLGRKLATGVGRGHRRRLEWTDVVIVAAANRLVQAGVRLGIVLKTLEGIREQSLRYPRPDELILVASGGEVLVVEDVDSVVNIVRGGQLVAGVLLADVIADLTHDAAFAAEYGAGQLQLTV